MRARLGVISTVAAGGFMATLAAGLSVAVVADKTGLAVLDDRSGLVGGAHPPYLRQKPLPCSVNPAHFTLLRAEYSGTTRVSLPPQFVRNSQGYLSDDQRNFHVIVTQAQLDSAGVFKKQLVGPGGSAELLVVANYDPPKPPSNVQDGPHGQPPPDLVVYVADPTSGETYGVFWFGVGCHD